MKLELDDTVLKILTQEAVDKNITIDQLVNEILRLHAFASPHNKGQINSAQIDH